MSRTRKTGREGRQDTQVPFSYLLERAHRLFLSDDEAAAEAGLQSEPGRTCSAVEYADYLELVSHARLTRKQKRILSSIPKTDFEHERTTPDGHFTLKWDTTGFNRVTDEIVDDAQADLQDAYSKYTTDFGQPPSPDTIEVLFDNAKTPQTVPPKGPISLPGQYMRSKADNRLQRKLTATHELFHVLQGGFGYPSRGYTTWFYEGGATWSEIVYYNGVNGAGKVPDIFDHPFKPIEDRSYGAVSFFIFLENFYDEVKTEAWFMVDWYKSNPDRGRYVDLWVELDDVAGLEPDYNSDRLLVQFALQAASKTWYKNTDGTVVIPPPRDAETVGYPVQEYSTMNLSLPAANQFAFTGHSMVGHHETTPRLKATGLYFWEVTAAIAASSYSVYGQFSSGQRMNPYVGGAVLDTATGAPAAGHPTVALSTEFDAQTFDFTPGSEKAYFVTAGPARSGFTNFTLDIGTHEDP